MSVLSTLTVKLEGEASSLIKTLNASGGAVTTFVSNGLKSLSNMAGGFGKLGIAAAAVGVGIAAGVAVGAKALYDLGATYDNAFDQIIAKTGATGDKLESYKTSAKNTYGEVTNSIGEVANVQSLLAVRSGLTDTALEGLTQTTLELAKVTGAEALPLADNLTRTFGAWNIATDKQSLAMDKLLKVSQLFGIDITELANYSADTQAAFENLGFTFEEQITIFGKWKAEGVNIENVLAGFQQSVSRLTKPTENLLAALAPFPNAAKLVGDSTTPLPEKFNAVRGVLDTLFASGKPEDDAKAKEIIFETFGKRSLNNMVDLFKNKRLEIGDVLPKILDPGLEGLVNRTNERMEDFGDKFTKAWHKVQNLIEPAASGFFDFVNESLEKLLGGDQDDAEKRLRKWAAALFPNSKRSQHGFIEAEMGEHPDKYMNGLEKIGKWWKENGDAITKGFQKIGDALDFLKPVFSWLGDHSAEITSGLTALAIVLGVVAAVAIFLGVTMVAFLAAPFVLLVMLIGWLWNNWSNIWGAIRDFFVETVWHSGIEPVWNAVYNWLTVSLPAAVGSFRDFWVAVWDWIKGAVDWAWQGIQAIFWAIVDWFVQLPGRVLGALGDLAGWLWQKGVDLLNGLWEGVKYIGGLLFLWYVGLPLAILGWIGDVAGTLWQKGVDLLQGLVNGAGQVALGIHGWLLDHVFTPIVGFFGDAYQWLLDAGKAVVQGLIDGIKSLGGKVVDGANWLKDTLLGPFSGSPIITGPLHDAGIEVGTALTTGIVAGIAAGQGPVVAAANGLTGAVVPAPIVPPGLEGGVPPTAMLPAPEETQAVADALGDIQQGWADSSLATAFGTAAAALAIQDNFDANTVQKTNDTQALANAIWANGMFTMLGTTTTSLDALNANTQSHFLTLSMLTQSTMSNVVQTMTTGASTAADYFVAALAARIPPLQFTLSSYAESVKAYGRQYLTDIGAPVTFARGGLMGPGSENHQPMIAPGGTLRVWAEPETGGEAYIPLGMNKRNRSEKILGTVASMFGMGLIPFAEGGLSLAELFWEAGSGTDWKNGVDIGRTIGGHADHAHAGTTGAPWQMLDAYLQSVGIAPGPGSTTGGQHAAGSLHYLDRAKDYGTAANGGIPGVDRIYQAFLALIGGGAYSAIPMPNVPGLPDFGPGIPAEQSRIMAFFMRQAMQKKLEDARTAMLSSMGGGSYPGGGSGPYKDYAMSLFGKYGWGPEQWSPLEQLVGHESGWNPNAINPSSGAWGLFQFLGKGPFDPDPYSQIWRGLEYIAGRYGSPANAWNFWLGHNWYGEGGILGAMGGAKLADSGVNLDPGWNSVFNGTGAIEELRPTPDADSLRPIEVHVHPSPGMDEEALARLTRRELEKVRADERFRGGSRR